MIKGKIKRAMSAAKQGFTIMETLLAASIFTIIATIATTVFVRTIQAQTRTEILNAIYEDGRVIMEQLTNEIQNGAIDYEEYYNVNVVQSGTGAQYGINYGVYGSRFYNPGWTFAVNPLLGARGANPENLGVECSYPSLNPTPPAICELYYSDSKDLDTGQSPYVGKTPTSQPADANALCNNTTGVCATQINTSQDGSQITSDELYLISENAEGTHKTIFTQMLLNSNNATSTKTSRDCGLLTETNLDCGIGKLKMAGTDTDNNGIVDTFKCMDNYNCGLVSAEAGTGAIVNDHLTEFNFVSPKGFVPITPFRTSIKSIQFTISPPEDPYKAFDEDDMQVHPYVTILMEIEPSFAERNRYRAYGIGTLKLQRTVTAGITRNVNSYPPMNDVGWICDVVKGSPCP